MKGLATLLLFIGLLGFVPPLYGQYYEEEATAELQEIRLAIDGMDCSACADKVKTALEDVRGVVECRIDQPASLASIKIEEGTNRDQLIQAVKNAGFDAFLPSEVAPAPEYLEY